MKKFLTSLFIIVISAWLVRFEISFLTGEAQDVIVNLTIALSLFGLGISFQTHHKTRTWVKKLIISFLFLFLVIWDLGYIDVVGLNSIFDVLGLEYQFVLYMFYIFFGYLFFD